MPTLFALLLAVVPHAGEASAGSVSLLPGPPSRAEAYLHYSLGLQARLTGDNATALAEFRRAQEVDPAAAPVRVEMARLYREMGRLEEKSGAFEMLKKAALKRPGKPEEIAELLAFCASEKASYLTGVDILCDGGVIASKES